MRQVQVVPQRLDGVVAAADGRFLPLRQQQQELAAVLQALAPVALEYLREHLLHRRAQQHGLIVKVAAQHLEVLLCALQRKHRKAGGEFNARVLRRRIGAQRMRVAIGAARQVFQNHAAAQLLRVARHLVLQQLQVAALAGLLVQLLLGAAQHLHDALRRKRLEQIVHHLPLQRLLDVDEVVVARQHDVLHRGIHLLQPGDHLHAVHVGHVHIGKHHVRLELRRLFQRVDGARRLRAQRKAAALKIHCGHDALAHLVLVVHEHQLVHASDLPDPYLNAAVRTASCRHVHQKGNACSRALRDLPPSGEGSHVAALAF